MRIVVVLAEAAEDIEQAFAGAETDRPHHRVGVLRGGRDRHRPAQCVHRLDEAERIGKCLDASGLNELLESVLLAHSVGGRKLFGVRHA